MINITVQKAVEIAKESADAEVFGLVFDHLIEVELKNGLWYVPGRNKSGNIEVTIKIDAGTGEVMNNNYWF